jgi:MFS family permease
VAARGAGLPVLSVGVRATGTRALAVGVVMAITMNAFEAMSVATAMPAVADDLGGDALYGAAFSAYMLADLISLVAAGEQADRRGPAVPFVGAVAVFAAGLVVAGVAPTMLVVVIGRALQGAGAGALASVAYVAVGRAWTPDQQPHMFALLAAGWVVPSLVAPAAAGFVSEQFSWRWVFLGLLPLLPVLAGLALPALTALGAPGRLRAPSRVPRAVVLAVGVGLLVAGLASDRVTVVVALAVPGAVVAWRAVVGLLPTGVTRAAPGLPAAVAARLWVGIGFFGADTFIPLAATRLHGATTLVGGLVITGASFSWTLGSILSARASGRRPPARTVRAGFIAVGLGIALTFPVIWSGTPLVATFFVWMVAGLGIGLVFNTTSVTAMGSATGGAEGLIASQLQIADALGFALVGGIGGALVALADRTSLTLAAALGIEFSVAFAASVVGALVAGRVTRAAPAAAAPV